jgi:hypothetical protein
MLKKLIMTLALAGSLFAMHEVELNLNDYDLAAKLNLDMGQFNPSVDPDTVFLGVGYLHGSQQHSDRDLSKSYDLYDVNFFVKQRLSKARNITLGLGTKLVYTEIEGEDFYALPLGLLVRYDLPLGLPVPFILGGDLYYSPQVLSWKDAKNYTEYDLFLDIQIIDRAAITAGYRKIDTDFDVSNGDLIFNEAAYIGVKFRF